MLKTKICILFMLWAVALSPVYAQDSIEKIQSLIDQKLATNPTMIRPQELYKLAEANLLLEVARQVRAGNIKQETIDLMMTYLQLWSQERSR